MFTFPICKNGLTPFTSVLREQINNVRHSGGKVFQCRIALQTCSVLLLFIILWTHHSQLLSARSCFERWISCTKIIFLRFSLWEGFKCGVGRVVLGGRAKEDKLLWWNGFEKVESGKNNFEPKIQTCITKSLLRSKAKIHESINKPFTTCRCIYKTWFFSVLPVPPHWRSRRKREGCSWWSCDEVAGRYHHCSRLTPLAVTFHLAQLTLYAPSGLCEKSCESGVIDFCRCSGRAILDGTRLVSLTFAFLLLILLCQTQHLSQHYPPPHNNKVLSTSSSSLALSAGAVEGCYRPPCLFWQCQKESSFKRICRVSGRSLCVYVSEHNCLISFWGIFLHCTSIVQWGRLSCSLDVSSLLRYPSHCGEEFDLWQLSRLVDS